MAKTRDLIPNFPAIEDIRRWVAFPNPTKSHGDTQADKVIQLYKSLPLKQNYLHLNIHVYIYI